MWIISTILGFLLFEKHFVIIKISIVTQTIGMTFEVFLFRL